MRRLLFALVVLIATASPVVAKPARQLSEDQKAKVLPWINRAVESVNSTKSPEPRVLKMAAMMYSDIGRIDLAEPLVARLSETDRAQVRAAQVGNSYRTAPAAAIGRAKEIKDPSARDSALALIRNLALASDDVTTAEQTAALVSEEFRASLAYQSICDYHFNRGEIAQAQAAAARIKDEGYG